VASNAFGVAYSPKLSIAISSVVVVGSGSQVPASVPPQLGDVRAISVGHYHVLAVEPSGKVFAWNNGPNGATNVPANLGPAKAVASSAFNSLALLESGRVVAWTPGNSSNPFLTNVPTAVTSIVAIANADNGGLAVRSNGTVVAWGSSEANPVPQGLSNVVSIAASGLHASALQKNGRVVAWGLPQYTAVPASLTDAIALSATVTHTLALRENGTITAWGVAVPPVPAQATNIVAISAGNMVNLALRADGRLILWGSASNQLAAQTAALSDVTAIAASHRSSFYAAVVGDGSPRITLHPHGQELPTGASIRLHARAVGQQPMTYQWLRNGQPVPGATSPTLVLDRQGGSQPGVYRLVASNALGSEASDEAAVDFRYAGTLAQALNAPEVAWLPFVGLSQEQFSTAAWIAQTEESYDGEGSARSGVVPHGGAVSLRTSIHGPGRLSFRWKVSSEEGYDWLAFTNQVGGNLRASHRISGETGWKLETIELPVGLNQLLWSYGKDGSVSAGQDAGWIDTVVFTPAPPVFTSLPEGITTYPGHNELIRVPVSSMSPATYTWLFNGVPLSNLTGGTNLLRAPDQPSTNSVRIIISNSVGQTSTEEFPFVVRATPLLQKPILSQQGLRLRLGWPDGGEMVQTGSSRFRLQTSTNLFDWELLDVWGVVTNGLLEYNAPLDEPGPQRFYRLTP
jgi:hypothetical protein